MILQVARNEIRLFGAATTLRMHKSRPPSPRTSPPGEGEIFVAPLNIYTTGSAGHSSAKPGTGVEQAFFYQPI